MVNATPVDAPYPAAEFLASTAFAHSQIALANCEFASDTPCSIPVRVGLFFDGTNNNLERDRDGKRMGLPDPETGIPGPLANRPLRPQDCSHSNIARLFRSYPADKQDSGYYSFYVSGVGTPFKEIGELTESAGGKAFARGGEARIIWGLLQILNAIHMAVRGQEPLFRDSEAGRLAQSYGSEVGNVEQLGNGKGPSRVMTHRRWFAPHLAKLKTALAAIRKPTIPSLRISVFGFSRGAAEAVAFCHFLDDLLEGQRLVGIDTRIDFLGVFDTVASVGGSASIARTLPLPGAVFDGHWSWANRILDPLPACVQAGRHFIATHELRMNFPVTRLQSSKGDKFKEVFYPGVHSDVGGGYAPGEQGKGRGGQGALLSQVPLLHMYTAARAAGVPLNPFSELEARDKIDFEVDAALASAWNAYTGALGKEGALLATHMKLYYRWRAARLRGLENTTSFHAATPQERQDLREANQMLAGDLEALRERRTGRSPAGSHDSPQRPFAPDDLARINKWHFDHAQSHLPLDAWERWALGIFERCEPLPPDVERFFDDYVHDSFAGFYLAGEVTEYDKRVKTADVMRRSPEELRGFDRKVHALATQVKDAQAKRDAGVPLTADEELLIRAAEHDTPYPIMSDEDADSMRSPVIATQTATRREGGGYIIRRGYYPHEGFIYRQSIHENELLQLSRGGESASYRHTRAPNLVELVWSDDLRRDITASRATARRETSVLA
ncbi:DUF2235 domain-containing protein [Aromatoleum toluvorans]|uniref:DUF2235 domain-containing protein n=1 Tax=Aromatoleum toluvorans TaxID=92002 RepID=A0ABX1PTB0_9RHOO|nr:DUF2235 domain-containing protein [Aromatoleum toluvorans]NMG42692.1 DUF2235 domain-containing protein [Aromatoleum toluvorans]